MIDALAQTLAQAVGRLAVELLIGLLHDVAILAAAVWAIIAAGRVPVIRRTPFLGRMLTDAERGARRMFLGPAQRAMRTGIAPRNLGWCIVLAVVGVAAVPTPARVPVVLAATWVTGRSWSDRRPGWWSHRQLVGALVVSGVLPKPREGDPPPSVSYRGAPQHGEHGTTVTVALPGGRSLSDVLSHREALAAALHVPTARLEVTQHEDDPANVIHVHVGNGATGETAAEVASAGTRNWSAPIRIGRDTRGEPVYLPFAETNSIIAGVPGSGKTSLVRILAAHVLLDPTADVWVFDGKGSTDYDAARPVCARFVSARDDDAETAAQTMLEDLLVTVQQRNAVNATGPGLLLVAEEWQDLRAALSKPARDRLDATLGRVVRQGRATGVHVVVSTQRPSVDDVPSGVRNLLTNRVSLKVRGPQDAQLILGSTPALSLPSRRGQALVDTGDGVRGVVLDRLDDAAWRALCARAAALRPTTTTAPVTPTPEPAPADAAPAADVAPVDPLLDAVLQVLRDGDPTGTTASEIHRQLPDWTRSLCPTARDLGVTLARSGLAERVKRGNDRVWRLPDHCPSTAPRTAPLTARGLPEDSPNGVSPRSNGAALPALPALPPTVPTPHAPAHVPAPERTAP